MTDYTPLELAAKCRREALEMAAKPDGLMLLRIAEVFEDIHARTKQGERSCHPSRGRSPRSPILGR